MGRPSVRIGVRLIGNPTGNRVVTCADVRACLELEYTTWTEKSYSPITDGDITNKTCVEIDDVNGVAYLGTTDGNSFKVMDLSDGTITTLIASNFFWSRANAYLEPSSRVATQFNKYVVVIDANASPPTIKVYSNGSLLWSYQNVDASTSITVCFSQKGTYLIITDDDNSKYRVFEGS